VGGRRVSGREEKGRRRRRLWTGEDKVGGKRV
jgi:hypothetical protein